MHNVDTPSGIILLENMASQKNRGNKVRGIRKKNVEKNFWVMQG